MTNTSGDPTSKTVEQLVALERDLGGTLGVYALPLSLPGSKDREPLRYRENERFPSASTIKVFVLLTLLEQAEAGSLALSDELVLDADEQVTGSGVLKALSPGSRYPLVDLATLMIIISDNSATNLLIDRLGVDAVNETCERRGWGGTYLAGKLQKGLTYSSYTCPFDLGDYFFRLWRGELLSPESTIIAQQIFRRQQLTDQLGGDIGYDSYSTETGKSSLIIASKSGSVRGVRNDAGVIETGNGAYALAIMTKDCPDERYHPQNLGSRVVRGVSKLVYDHFGPFAD